MCNPAVIALVPAAIEMGKNIFDHVNQEQRARENARASKEAFAMTDQQLTLRGAQETQATAQTVFAAERQARQADAQARVSAGAAGVAGASVDMLQAGIARDAATSTMASKRNLEASLTQLSMERRGAQALMRNRLNEAPNANPFATGLKLTGAAARGASDVLSVTPTTKK